MGDGAIPDGPDGPRGRRTSRHRSADSAVLGVAFAVVGAVYLARTGGAASRLLPRAPSRLGAPPRQARPRRVRLGSGVLGRAWFTTVASGSGCKSASVVPLPG